VWYVTSSSATSAVTSQRSPSVAVSAWMTAAAVLLIGTLPGVFVHFGPPSAVARRYPNRPPRGRSRTGRPPRPVRDLPSAVSVAIRLSHGCVAARRRSDRIGAPGYRGGDGGRDGGG